MSNLNKKEAKQLAAQLRSPNGSSGIDVGHEMHRTNINMTTSAVKALKLCPGDHILEIGHGNAAHVKQVLGQANNLRYTGLDISQTMHEEAQRINKPLIDVDRASFHLYEGDSFPFPDIYFQKIMTINTIYFWDNPQALLGEAYRVLDSEGLFSISFAQKSFMKKLSFIEYGFRLYDNDDIKQLVEQSSFIIADLSTQDETVKSKDGSQVKRVFTTVSLQKE